MNVDAQGRPRQYGPNGVGRPAPNKLDPEERKRRKAARCKAWKDANPDKVAANHRKFYGYPEPTRPRPKLCECCGQKCKTKKGLALDHDHVTGKFRGWLCANCNTGIGKLGDNVEGLERAINYLNGRLA